MPKLTFENLPLEKRQAIEATLREEFETHSLADATVKNIVTALDISRGSFYQYFESLTESYFYLLDKTTAETHTLFLKILKDSHHQLAPTLDLYGVALADEIYDHQNFALYKNRVLHWNAQLEKEWQAYKKQAASPHDVSPKDKEKMYFIKAIVHTLIQRIFLENWDKETFLEKYQQQVDWIKNGINDSPLHL